jgi:hypothetical protein
VIPLELARQLKQSGLRWKPALGDRFAVPDRDMDDEVFVVSNMTVEVHDLPDGPVLGFNGTTEWALDDVETDEAVWLPREDQLRTLLGGTFLSLTRTSDAYRVVIELLGTQSAFDGVEPAVAYALALLHLLGAAGASTTTEPAA